MINIWTLIGILFTFFAVLNKDDRLFRYWIVMVLFFIAAQIASL